MKKWTLIRMASLVMASVLIIFGSIGNAFRTMKFGWEKIRDKR